MNKTLELYRLNEDEIDLLNLFRKAGPNAKFVLSFARTAAGEEPVNVIPIRQGIEVTA